MQVSPGPAGPQARAEMRLVRVGIASALFLILMLITLSILGTAFTRDHDEAVRELDAAAHFHRELDRVLQLVVDTETAQRGYLLTGDPVFLDPLRHAQSALPDALDEAVALLSARHGHGLADEMRLAVEAKVSFAQMTVDLFDDGHRDEALAQVASGEGRALTDQVRDIVARAHEREERLVQRTLGHAEESRWWARTAFMALVVLAFILGLTLAASVRTNLVRTRAALRRGDEEARRFRMLAESARDLVCIEDLQGRIEYVSPSVASLLGYQPDEYLALSPYALLDDEERIAMQATVRGAIAMGKAPPPQRHHLRRKDGTRRLFETTIELAEGESGTIAHVHTLSRDITDDVEHEQRLSVLAGQDELTGLLNRRGFGLAGTQLIAQSSGKRSTDRMVLLFCDVNGLKAVNDTLGHEEGDALLCDAAAVLRDGARGADLVGRIGGDEFVVLGIVRDPEGAEIFRERVLERVKRHNDTHQRRYRLSLSIGTALREGTEALPELIARADAAMYLQKGGRGPTTPSGRWVVRSMDEPR